MLKSGTVLKHGGWPDTPQVPPTVLTTPRSSPLSKRTKENLPVVFVEAKEGPCWAKNQSVWLGAGEPSAFIREVPLESEPPEDIPRASTIVIVNFYEPILVTAGDDEVAVILGVDDGVTVGPVRIQ